MQIKNLAITDFGRICWFGMVYLPYQPQNNQYTKLKIYYVVKYESHTESNEQHWFMYVLLT